MPGTWAMPLIANTSTNVPRASAKKLQGGHGMLGVVQKQARLAEPSEVAAKCV